jgi:hypothetical protein
MRRFSSYGHIDTDLYYYAPRKELIDHTVNQLLGENPEKGGHYLRTWAPRQTGKSWILNKAFNILEKDKRFDAVKLELETMKMESDLGEVLLYIDEQLARDLNKEPTGADTPKKYEVDFDDPEKGVKVMPIFVETGN